MARSSRFFPRTVSTVAAGEVIHTFHGTEVHEEEIIGDKQKSVLNPFPCQMPSPSRHEVKQQLPGPQEGVKNCSLRAENKNGVQGKQGKQQERSRKPAQHAVGDVLQAEDAVAQGIHQFPQAPHGLQASRCNPYLAFCFLVHVGRACFCGVGIGAVGGLVAACYCA